MAREKRCRTEAGDRGLSSVQKRKGGRGRKPCPTRLQTSQSDGGSAVMAMDMGMGTRMVLLLVSAIGGKVITAVGITGADEHRAMTTTDDKEDKQQHQTGQ